ncbi:DUF1642 domain-containing protein [Listeria seeligeri]|uniref:DUF1642 domain-containing protein n=1 Tax=Listeria seeligeri TaxID=1640 RepID=UPI00164E7A65|nr:DUF1642 domain-containing protein [Listeria seeligeri]MBC6123114.1 DUF1642 domain-containing protein [Listeria seeligeri]
MKFKKGDRVQFISESSLAEGVIWEVKASNHGISYKVESDHEKNRWMWIDEGHLIPLTPLPAIPKFVADVLQVQKEKWWWSLSESLNLKVYACTSFVKEYSVDIRIKDWLSLPSNQELFARAWMDGYEVEDEPLYYVRFISDNRSSYLNLQKNRGRLWVSDYLESDEFKAKFTEKEIKNMNENYWAFKVPVEDLEEVVK